MKRISFSLLTIAILSFILVHSCSTDDKNTVAPIVQILETEQQVKQYTLTVTSAEGGTVSNEGGTYDEGTTIELIATPSEGYEFVKWEEQDKTTPELTITINSNITISAIFKRICVSDQILYEERGDCNESLTFNSEFSMNLTESTRVIISNSIPNHLVGLFGGGPGSLNPHTITEQNKRYELPLNPTIGNNFTPLLGQNGPRFSFGIILNGIELDPVAAEPFPHEDGPISSQLNANWEWNLEATTSLLGLDCNNAHVQPSGQYHYHGAPTNYLNSLNLESNTMTLVGYAADGFPIYYKYAYTDATDNTSAIELMTSSYQLKLGNRPGDGISAPCDVYNGVYVNDYEYVDGLGTLDEANGRTGITPEFPNGIYYYIITDEFPGIPRYLKGIPSDDFKLGS
ncbi:MAG: YHYH protein [Flavobacteriaceae bacterium]